MQKAVTLNPTIRKAWVTFLIRTADTDLNKTARAETLSNMYGLGTNSTADEAYRLLRIALEFSAGDPAVDELVKERRKDLAQLFIGWARPNVNGDIDETAVARALDVAPDDELRSALMSRAVTQFRTTMQNGLDLRPGFEFINDSRLFGKLRQMQKLNLTIGSGDVPTFLDFGKHTTNADRWAEAVRALASP